MPLPLSRRAFVASAAAAAAGLGGSAASAAGKPVRFALARRTADQSLPWIGAEAGIFAKHGVEPSFPAVGIGDAAATEGLSDGKWEFAQTAGLPVAENVLRGGDAVI